MYEQNGFGLIAIGVSLLALAVSIIAAYYTRRKAEVAKEALSLNAFQRALAELGTREVRDFRRHIHQNFPEYISESYSSKEGEEIKLWVKCGDLTPKSTSIRVKPLEKEEDRIAFEEIAVRVDRVGFMFYTLGLSEKLEKKFFDWLCVMFCDAWNKLAPHIVLERKARSKKVKEESPKPIYFTPYFEKLVYDIYQYYKKWVGEKAKIFCLNPECSVEVS